MNSIELIEIEQHKLIVEKCNELLKVCFKNDVDYLQKILKKSKKKIQDYNDKSLTIIDIRKKELGIWKSTIKKVVHGKYYNPIIKNLDRYYDGSEDFEYLCEEHKEIYTCADGTKDWFYNVDKFCSNCKKEYLKREKKTKDFYDHKENIKTEFKNACDNTIFCKDLMLKYILLNRKLSNYNNQQPLLFAIKDTIHIEILKTFQNQNQKLITKYI